MTTVLLTKTRSGFVNVPASFRIGHHDDGSSSLVSCAEYALPEGYRLAKTTMDEDAIFDASNRYCEIIEHSSGRPKLVSGAREMPVLATVN